MEYLTNEVLKKILVSSGESADIESVLSKESEAAVGHGDNYCSNVVRLKLKLKLTTGKIFCKTLILKIFIEDLELSAKEEMIKYFANEATMYTKILVHLGDLAEKHNIVPPRNWPNCYLANTDVAIFDDLKEEGYVSIPRQKMKLNEAIEVLRYIGRLHALSVVAERRKLIDPTLIRKVYTWVYQEGFTSNFMRKAVYTVGDIVFNWGSKWEDAGRKMMNISKTITDTLYDLYCQDVKLRVVNHGDIWVTNLMVKYLPDQTVKSLRFLDFQNSTYNSYGWDLVYFLFSSLPGHEMMQNYDDLLTYYRNEFVFTLKNLDEDPSIAPTMEEIKADIVRLHPFCLIITCTLLGVVFNTSKHPIQVDELITNDFKLRSLFTGDQWESSMKLYIKYFQEHNVL